MKYRKTAAAMLTATATIVAIPTAFATNLSTVSGENITGCQMNWNAESVYSSDASLYPAGTLTLLTGQPVNGGPLGGNGGYISEVRPEYNNGSGIFEINRFVTGNLSAGTAVLHVRIPLAVDKATTDGVLSVSLPDTGNAWTAADSPVTATITRWGSPYTNYTWNGGLVNYTVDQNTVTASVNPLAAGTGTVVEFTSPVNASFLSTLSDYKATYNTQMADKSACVTPPPVPGITQDNGDNNDITTLDLKGGTVFSDTGWIDNKKTVVVTAPEGYYYYIDGQYYTQVDVIYTDNGKYPVTTTVEPVYSTVTTKVLDYKKVTTCTNPIVGTFQVDSYLPVKQSQVNTIAANSARNILPYRYDGPKAPLLSRAYKAGTYSSLWGRSTYEFVTVTRNDVTKYGSLRAAIDAKTTKVPNIGGSLGINKRWTTAWKLAPNATMSAPWTYNPDTSLAKSQVEYDKVSIPAPVCTTSKVVSGSHLVTETKQTGTTTISTIAVPKPTTPTVVPHIQTGSGGSYGGTVN